jgi:hypothetical protein
MVETARSHRQNTSTMVPSSRRSSWAATDRWKLLSMTAPRGASAATAIMATTAARPSVRDVSTSGTGTTDINASLMVSLAINGSSSRAAIGGASVDLPLAGGPDTTT